MQLLADAISARVPAVPDRSHYIGPNGGTTVQGRLLAYFEGEVIMR